MARILRAGNAPVMNDPHVVQEAAARMQAVRNTKTCGLLEWQGIVRTVEWRGIDFRR